ncbi:PHP domain-containing protein [uncultured Amnibacterium sp.]|uniref:PHP domain-containing protein n=1 Tax=uncultured Amnibacterium sp. TaxID=1631851 RepID=UPI0035CC2357
MRSAGGADLHTHSAVSDGTESPADLIRAAVAAGLGTVALTDHDTTAGWGEAREEAGRHDIVLIPGLELSTLLGFRSVHMLGYLVDPQNSGLVAETERIRTARRERAQRIVDRLSRDHDIQWSDVVAQTMPGTTVGRPHIADALVALGLESDRSAAFAGLLHPRAGYVEPHYAPTPLQGVRLIRAAGGVPVLAHPGASGRDRVLPEDVVGELVEAGLFGLELYHRENTPDGRERVAELARRFDLAVTGSSDYHGTGKPNRLGEHTTAPAVVEQILELGTGTAPVGAALAG